MFSNILNDHIDHHFFLSYNPIISAVAFSLHKFQYLKTILATIVTDRVFYPYLISACISASFPSTKFAMASMKIIKKILSFSLVVMTEYRSVTKMKGDSTKEYLDNPQKLGSDGKSRP